MILIHTKQYSSKQLSKNVLAAEPKTIDDHKPHHKYETNKTISAERLKSLKTVSFDKIRSTNIVQAVPLINEDVASIEQKKEIINWEPTPLTDPSKLTNQYLMLSKTRLTSEFAVN